MSIGRCFPAKKWVIIKKETYEKTTIWELRSKNPHVVRRERKKFDNVRLKSERRNRAGVGRKKQ